MSPSFFLPLLLKSALLPFAVALTVLVLARASARGALALSAALLAGLLSAFFAIHPQWSPWPAQALDWLPWIGLLGLGGACAVERLGMAASRHLARAALGAAVALLTLSPIFSSAGAVRVLVLAAACALVVALAWALLAPRRAGNGPAALSLLIVAGGAGVMLMIDASQSLGQLSGALAMTCAAALLVLLWRPGLVFDGTAVGTALLLLVAILLNAHVYAGFALVYLALLLAGLAGAALPAWLEKRGRTPAVGFAYAACAVASGLPVLVGLALVLKSAQDSGGY